MNVKSLNCVQVGSFLVVLQKLHNVLYGSERMCFSIKVFLRNWICGYCYGRLVSAHCIV